MVSDTLPLGGEASFAAQLSEAPHAEAVSPKEPTSKEVAETEDILAILPDS
jgi:hypothetical protein